MALVLAKGALQLKYIQVEYPIVPHIVEIDFFAEHVTKRFNIALDLAARKFLMSLAAKTGAIDERVKAILEDLAGYNLL